MAIRLTPRERGFYPLFVQAAEIIADAADQLATLVAAEPPNREAIAKQIKELETEGDELTHQILIKLNSSFITPFDREDIHELVGGLDDIVDTIDALAKRFVLYHVQSMEPEFVEQTKVLVRATEVLSDAVYRLRKSRKLSQLHDALVEIHRLENVGDDNNHAAMSRLFDGRTGPLEVMKWKELYDLVETAIDACEDVGNTLERIVLKNG
jgi:hypothetical protein